MFRSCVIAVGLILQSASWAALHAADVAQNPGGSGTEPKGIPIELKIINESVEAYEVNSHGDPFHIFREKNRPGRKGRTAVRGDAC